MPIVFEPTPTHRCTPPWVHAHTEGTIWECHACEKRWHLGRSTIDHGLEWLPISRQYSDQIIRRARKAGG